MSNNVRWVDGEVLFGQAYCVRFDRRDDALRLVRHLMVRGCKFVYEQEEGSHDIFISTHHDLGQIRNKFNPTDICL